MGDGKNDWGCCCVLMAVGVACCMRVCGNSFFLTSKLLNAPSHLASESSLEAQNL